jgi:hypothetical protein
LAGRTAWSGEGDKVEEQKRQQEPEGFHMHCWDKPNPSFHFSNTFLKSSKKEDDFLQDEKLLKAHGFKYLAIAGDYSIQSLAKLIVRPNANQNTLQSTEAPWADSLIWIYITVFSHSYFSSFTVPLPITQGYNFSTNEL